MRVRLSCELPVSRVAVFAEMAWLERRPELGLLCRLAREHGGRITAAVVQSALPGLSDPGAANVVAWARMLGLCDAGGGLTKLGHEVAERDEAPVPEQGTYDLWYVQHPVVGRRVLAAERLSSSRDTRFEAIAPVSVGIDFGTLFRSLANPKDRFLVRALPGNHGEPGAIRRETRATCRFRWVLDSQAERDQWQLEGTIEVRQGHGQHVMQGLQHEPESDGLDLWKTIDNLAPSVRELGGWNARKRLLAVSYDDLEADEVRSFRKTFTVTRLAIPGKGEYANAAFEDVPLGPLTPEDAQRWAMARFVQALDETGRYRSRGEARALFAELSEDTPLEEFGVTLPAHDELLGQVDERHLWSLAAPVDLAPFPLTVDDLGPLRVGAPAPTSVVRATVRAEPDSVRVPYRGGWSMRRLVDALLAGAKPRKVLLCDRYVRGADNLETLTLLVGALRLVAPNVVVDVWTDEVGADLRQIETITGANPRTYREKFGANRPHDRYLLVLPDGDRGFGWQLSNSPLHARINGEATPEAPLRWKDLAGSRVSSEELEPALRQWLSGGGR